MPGSFGGWLLLLEQFGTWPLADVLEFAIGYADGGYSVSPGITFTIERVEPLLRDWPGVRRALPAGTAARARRSGTRSSPRRGRRVVESGRPTEDEIEGARACYYEGFVADEIDRFSRGTAAF